MATKTKGQGSQFSAPFALVMQQEAPRLLVFLMPRGHIELKEGLV